MSYYYLTLVSVMMRCGSVVLVLIILEISFITAAECDLEKIFRTPKDMSKVNFDHFEIVERNNFDSSEVTTTETPSSVARPKKSGSNVANAQVLVRFGGDDVHGSNHIMKIPPQCRHIVGNAPTQPTNLYYPQPPHRYSSDSHYYHPYPPPIPFVFPNYYFSQYGDEPEYLSPKLREYFTAHPEHLVEGYPTRERPVFIHGRPLGIGDLGDYVIQGDVVNVRKPAIKSIERPNIVLTSNHKSYPGIVQVRPRILEPLDLSNEDIEEAVAEKAENKRDCVGVEKATMGKKNAVEYEDESCSEERNEVLDRSVEKSKKHHKKSKEDKKHHKKHEKSFTKECTEIEELLDKALVAYKCLNCTGSPKMLVSYPITHRPEQIESESTLYSNNCSQCSPHTFANDMDGLTSLNTDDIKNDCKCVNCQCHKKYASASQGGKFANDLDDLITVVLAKIIEPDEYLPKTPKRIESSVPYPVVPAPKVTQIDLGLGDIDLPYQTSLNPSVNDYESSYGYKTALQRQSASSYSQIENNPPQLAYSQYSASGSGYRENPDNTIYYQAPTEVNTLNLKTNQKVRDPKIEYKSYVVPASYYSSTKVQEPLPKRYLPTTSSPLENPTFTPYPVCPVGSPTYHYFPEPQVSLQRPAQKSTNSLPRYFKIIPRDDLELVPASEFGGVSPKITYLPPTQSLNHCRKCGHRHAGGNYCDNCGYSVAYSPSSGARTYCPTCPKETRQYNEW